MMTKDEYLAELKNNIQALTLDEQQEALQYYSDYFDEAGDDQKVISELGTPENLAQTIVQKFANAVAKSSGGADGGSSDGDGESDAENDVQVSDALFYEFAKKSVKSVEIKVGAAKVVFIPGAQFTVETRGIDKAFFSCRLSEDGLLSVSNTKKLNLDFWNHERRRHVVPRILFTIPDDVSLELFRVQLGAGELKMKETSISCYALECEVGAGNLVASGINAQKASVRCGAGNLELSGNLYGKTNMDCGVGNIKLDLSGNASDYSYDLKLGLGSFKFNDEKKSGICQVITDEKKMNHLSVNCGMGNVTVRIGQ